MKHDPLTPADYERIGRETAKRLGVEPKLGGKDTQYYAWYGLPYWIQLGDRTADTLEAAFIQVGRAVVSCREACGYAELERWKDAVEDAAAISFINSDGKTPREILDLIRCWEHQVALDPNFSKEAKDLFNAGFSIGFKAGLNAAVGTWKVRLVEMGGESPQSSTPATGGE